MSSLPEPGMRLSGHLLSEEIGRGGFSRVFKAEPPGGGPAVAIKVAVRPELVSALRSEGALLRRVRGSRFVAILEDHLDEDPPFFVMELVKGGSLRELLERSPDRRLDPAAAEKLARGILEGVAFMHAEGLVHGDLKPENVLLDEQGEPRIADLGLSRADKRKLALASEVQRSEESGRGGIHGTFDYMAPEVRKGAELSPSTDVFALGVLLYEALVGHRPLGLFQLPGEALAREGIQVPERLDQVVFRALAHDPEDRFPDAGAMLAALNGVEAQALAALPDHSERGTNRVLLGVERAAFEHSVSCAAFAIVPVSVVAVSILAIEGHAQAAIEWTALAGALLWIAVLAATWRYARARRALVEHARSMAEGRS